MKTIFCDNSYKEKWNDFVIKNSTDFGLLQGFEWGELKGKSNDILRLAITDDDDKILAIAQVIVQPLKLGKTLFLYPAWSNFGG